MKHTAGRRLIQPPLGVTHPLGPSAHKSTSTARRRETGRATRSLLERAQAFFTQRGVAWACVYIAVYTVISVLLTVPAREQQGYRIDQLQLKPIVSRQDINVRDDQATRSAQQSAADAVPLPFRRNAEFLQELRTRLLSVQSFIDDEQVESIPATARQGLELTQQALTQLHHYRSLDDPNRAWALATSKLITRLGRMPIVADADAIQIARHGWDLSLADPEPTAKPEPKTNLTNSPAIDQDDAQAILKETLYRIGSDQAALASKVQELVAQSFGPTSDSSAIESRPKAPALETMLAQIVLSRLQPIYVVDTEALTARREQATAQTKTLWQIIPAGTTLVQAGKRLTERDFDLLSLERAAFIGQRGGWWLLVQRLGVGLLTLVTALGLWSYLYQYKRRVVENPARGFAVLAVLLLMQLIAVQGTLTDPNLLWLTATLPTILAAMIFVVVYDQRTALAIGLMHMVMVMFALKLPISVGLVTMTGVGVAITMLPDVRSRSQMLRVGLVTGLAMSVATVAGMVAAWPIYLPAVQDLLWTGAASGIASGLIAGMVVHSLISLDFLERVFSVTTALTLKDLNDAGHPLLQRLAQDAPGTYQHSLRIADMTEAAAESIGANSLLCRVGAMYHDIGKVNKPSYFIENQGGGPNKHDKLSPAMSLLIIIGHVKDGLEMAREYKLPQPIRHMLESHHGTTLVEYFYHAAKTQAQAEAEQVQKSAKGSVKSGPVDEFQFRYPGPKPQTKEAGILLLCDSLEAAARAMDDPTSVRLEQLVKTISKKRLMDGQFDDCSLTLKELARIEASVTKTLCAAYHGRIKYPAGDSGKNNKTDAVSA